MQARRTDMPTMFHAHAPFNWPVRLPSKVETDRPRVSPSAPACPLPLSAVRVAVWWSGNHRWMIFYFFSLLSLVAGKYTSVLAVCECFIFIPELLISLLLLISSMKILICCNCVLQLKIIIYVCFQWSPYSFDFWFVVGSFNYFGMQVLIYSNWIIQLKIVIYSTFHFSSYCFFFKKNTQQFF